MGNGNEKLEWKGNPVPGKNVLGWSPLPIQQKIDQVESNKNNLGESNMIMDKVDL